MYYCRAVRPSMVELVMKGTLDLCCAARRGGEERSNPKTRREAVTI